MYPPGNQLARQACFCQTLKDASMGEQIVKSATVSMLTWPAPRVVFGSYVQPGFQFSFMPLVRQPEDRILELVNRRELRLT